MTPLGDKALQVLRLLAEGNTQAEVARKLGLSYFTVRAHTRQVLQELGARNTAHAVHLGHQRGLLS